MTNSDTPPGLEPPSAARILKSVLIAAIAAGIVLVLFILPAEYGIDPTGIGRATGISQLGSAPTRTIAITDVVGGNESVFEAEIPEYGDPVPLPNPSVFQESATPARTQTFQITIPPGAETEIKTVLEEAKVVVYSWQIDRGTIYSDFHGHTPEAGNDFFVRYKEHQEGSEDNGSLVAPFAGEHGWYWLNYNEYPVVVSLSVTGYFEDTIDYGIF
jgi:hypothetical protein